MQITSATQPRASQAAPKAPPAESPPTDGYQPTWHDSVPLQIGAWTLSAGASAVLGSLGGPQVGMLAAGAVGAVTGVVTATPESRWYDYAAAAVWGFGMGSAVGLISNPTLAGGLAIGALHGTITGYAWAKGPSS